MRLRSPEEVKLLILDCLDSSTLPLTPDDLSDDFDMRAQGLIDSLGFMQLLVALEARLGFDIDLADLDPADLTVVGPLCRHIAATEADAKAGR